MKKATRILLLLIIFVLMFTACSPKQEESAALNVGALKGPSSLGLLQLIDSKEKAGNAEVNFTIAGAPDEITAQLLSGSLDAACVPINLAPVLYNKTEGEIQLGAVTTYGMLYIVGEGEPLNDISELKGKTVYASGQGSTPEYVITYLLDEAGIADDVELIWLNEHSEVAAHLLADGGYALLPEPFVTTVTAKNENLSVSLDLNQLWNDTTGSKLMMTAFVVRKEYAQNNADTLRAFLDLYKKSAEYTNSDPAGAAQLAVSCGIMDNAKIAEKAIPRCSITYISSTDAQDALNTLYSVFFDKNPASVGGALPGKDFIFEN